MQDINPVRRVNEITHTDYSNAEKKMRCILDATGREEIIKDFNEDLYQGTIASLFEYTIEYMLKAQAQNQYLSRNNKSKSIKKCSPLSPKPDKYLFKDKQIAKALGNFRLHKFVEEWRKAVGEDLEIHLDALEDIKFKLCTALYPQKKYTHLDTVGEIARTQFLLKQGFERSLLGTLPAEMIDISIFLR